MDGKLQRIKVETTWGSIGIEGVGGKIARCTLPFLAKQPETPFAIKSSGTDAASRFVVAALSGKAAKMPSLLFSEALAKGNGKPEGTDFQRQVWQAITEIPAGETKTYGELARAVGRPRAYRAVANACGKNPLPIFIPCHRVVAANGEIGGFSAGLPWKRLLLSSNQAGYKTGFH